MPPASGRRDPGMQMGDEMVAVRADGKAFGEVEGRLIKPLRCLPWSVSDAVGSR